MITDLAVAAIGIALAAGGLLYGCIKVHPASPVRWLIYAAVACVTVEYAVMPILPLFELQLTAADQVVAIVGTMFANEVLMERILPWWL